MEFDSSSAIRIDGEMARVEGALDGTERSARGPSAESILLYEAPQCLAYIRSSYL